MYLKYLFSSPGQATHEQQEHSVSQHSGQLGDDIFVEKIFWFFFRKKLTAVRLSPGGGAGGWGPGRRGGGGLKISGPDVQDSEAG